MTGKAGGLQSMGSQRVRCDLVTEQQWPSLGWLEEVLTLLLCYLLALVHGGFITHVVCHFVILNLSSS